MQSKEAGVDCAGVDCAGVACPAGTCDPPQAPTSIATASSTALAPNRPPSDLFGLNMFPLGGYDRSRSNDCVANSP